MSVFTLDAIREAAEAKYASTDIALDEKTTVRLLNPLRLPKADRDALQDVQGRFSEEEDVDQAEVFRYALRIVAEDKKAIERLLTAVGDDLAVLAQIFQTYTGGTSVGEA